MANPAVPAWEVLTQVPSTGLGPDRRAVEGMKIGFVTAKGVHDFVFIANERYNAENVKAAILARVMHSNAIADLKG